MEYFANLRYRCGYHQKYKSGQRLHKHQDNYSQSSFTHWFDSQLPFKIPQWGCYSTVHKVMGTLPRLSSKLVDFGRYAYMNLETTSTDIIAFGIQFIIFQVCNTLIYKVSDKLSDFENGELYDMLLWFHSRKKSCLRSSLHKKQLQYSS